MAEGRDVVVIEEGDAESTGTEASSMSGGGNVVSSTSGGRDGAGEFEFVEVNGDLFSSTESMAHCVSRDLHMGKGVAVGFKQLFGRVDELRAQDKGIGEVAFLHVADDGDGPGRYIFYLITKERYFHKPTYDSLASTLLEMRELCLAYGVTRLSIPILGCGLDGLEWEQVTSMIKMLFAECAMRITVYHYEPPAGAATSTRRRGGGRRGGRGGGRGGRRKRGGGGGAGGESGTGKR